MKKLGYNFKNKKIFSAAITQSGASATENNERLEFLGDRVLGLAVANLLYETFQDEREGCLARRYAYLVSTKVLAKIAIGFGLDKIIKHGHMTDGKMEHIVANAMESVIAAIYLDGGWNAAKRFVYAEWKALALKDEVAPKDPKTALQELSQHSDAKTLPKYEFLESKKNVFKARVFALDKTAVGTGPTKKSATIDAAEKLLEKL